MKFLYFILFLVFCTAQAQNFWTKTIGPKQNEIIPAQKGVPLDNVFMLDHDAMAETLWALQENESLDLSFPDLEGNLVTYSVKEWSNFELELQERYPHIRSYVGKSDDDPTAYLRISIDPKGFSAMILRPDNKNQFIEKVTENQLYAVYNKRIVDKSLPKFECTTEDVPLELNSERVRTTFSDAAVFKTFRIAISTDGEYTVFHGGTVDQALAAINTTLTRINGIYEVDLAVHLNLIAINNAIIFTNPVTDPYSGDPRPQLQSTLNSVIGAANYDVGHLLSANGSGGNAGCIGCICNDLNKGSGYSALSSPVGDYFDVDYVAHEIGHQLGANHSFSFSTNELTGYNVEPGSGSTIMGYAGITGSTDVQPHSDPYFVYANVAQIQANLQNKPCAQNVTPGNATPTGLVNISYEIPKSTPFKLTGEATDDQPESLTYCWEQNNSATGTSIGSNSFPFSTKTTGPNFRSFNPTTSKTRFFPDFQSVLNGNLCPTWECVSSVSRFLQFAFTVRDNQPMGQTKTSFANLQVNANAGPFKVTSPTITTEIAVDSSFDVSWDVANTNLDPVNCQTVNILFSNDGGQNFTMVASNTPNDGNETITPTGFESSLDCIVMVEAADNVFYALSDKFSYGYSVNEVCNTYSYNGAPINIQDGTNSISAVASIPIPAPSNTGAAITSITANVGITHTYVQDLVIIMQSPSSTNNYLWRNQCGDQNNMSVTFSDAGSVAVCNSPVSGTYKPFTSLSVYLGQVQTGNWLIGVGDFGTFDVGTLDTASINVCSSSFEPLSIDDIQQNSNDFTIYPNPADHLLKIKSDTDYRTYKIFNAEGRLISQGTLNENEINVSELPTGAYLLQLNGNSNEYQIKPFLIKR